MKRLFPSLHILTFLLLIVLLPACKQSKDIIPSEAFISYIHAYTGGVISKSSSIKIELAQELPVVNLNQEIESSKLQFSPAIKGKAHWIDNKTIEFVPDSAALKSGQLYTASFKLGDFMEVPKEVKQFDFSFRVIESDFMVSLQEIDIQSSSPDRVSLTGEIRFSDTVEKEVAEQMISASPAKEKEKLNIVLNGPKSSNLYGFSIEDIVRTKVDYSLKTKVKGDPMGISKEKEIKTLIPAINGHFQTLSAKRIHEPENGIQITFSEPISETQDLNGLIVIPDMKSYVFQVRDNKVNVFYETGASQKSVTININEGIRSTGDKALAQGVSYSFREENLKPQVRLLSKGNILPDSENLNLSFQAVNLRAVDIKIIRIFQNNVLSFLQRNTLNTDNELRRSGRLVYKKTLRLDSDPATNLKAWNNYSIDLSKLIKQEPGAIYRVEFSFKQDYSSYTCDGSPDGLRLADSLGEMTTISSSGITEQDEEYWDNPQSYYSSYFSEDMDWNVFDWRETENPCHPSYFMSGDRRVSCNVLASKLGLICKQNSNNKLWATVTDLLTTQPVGKADLVVYNFQLQEIARTKTDKNGFAELQLSGKPFVAVASSGKESTYLKLVEGEDNLLSRFDIDGKELKKGLKGYVYGERGVWRPGDTLHISFILDDIEKRLPDKHPVSLEMYNPRGQFYSKNISTQGVNGFYTFSVPTRQDDPTGVWNGYIKVGGAAFHKSFRIETIKPNRLKINLELPKVIKASLKEIPATLHAAWLTGATASELKAGVEMSLRRTNQPFPRYKEYNFNNPACSFSSNKIEVQDKKLDTKGNLNFKLSLPEAKDAPGMLQASITSRVYEPGGDVNFNTTTVPYSPFSSYVGVKVDLPNGKYAETDKEHMVDLIVLNEEGKPIDRANLVYKIYKIDWSWWWEDSGNAYSSYINNTSIVPEMTGRLTTVNGKARFPFRVDYPEWGPYFIYIKNLDSGHATGGRLLVDWPEWRGRANRTNPSGITMLSFSVDKDSYEIGETVSVIIPQSSKGRALVAIENGSTVLKQEWIDLSKDEETKYQFTVTPDMAPNVYVHVSLLQPHAQTLNELPIRIYGVVPVFVTNKESQLEPLIKMPEVLQPEKEYSVTISEKQGKAMTYTLAVVDDGLLDLTNFKTPDPWTEFYSRVALGIRTWDMFDQVIGAYSGTFSSLFSVGGDEMMKSPDAKANRFRPVVKFLGPFTLAKGKSNTHKITLPLYVGSVRTMVVAGQDGAFGHAEQTTPVRSPLMLLSTLPRTVSIGEEIDMPVNVFAMEGDIKEVSLSFETTGKIKAAGESKKKATFSQPGDQLVSFKLKAGMSAGKETIKISATGNGHTASETIEIEVRNPNPAVTQYETKVIEAGKSTELNYLTGDNSENSRAKLEVSRIPSVDISRRFDFLYNYDHHCTEQLTSVAMPLLFIHHFKEMDTQENETSKKNIQEAIKKLYSRQLANGGFTTWPGAALADEWVSSYVGNFLVLAQEQGYEVNKGVISKWRTFQRNAAQNWNTTNRSTSNHWQTDLMQAYRLYTLALAGYPETGAMNRMKEIKGLSLQAKWRLAAAYALTGKASVGNELIFNAQTDVKPYDSDNVVYGSFDRDEAMILETMVLLDRGSETLEQARKVSRNLSNEQYFSTQSTAFSLLAMGRLAEKLSGSIEFEWTVNGKKQTDVKSAKAVWQTDLNGATTGKVEVKNVGKGELYVDLITHTQVLEDKLPEQSSNIRLKVEYLDMNGKPMDIKQIRQGSDLRARVTVSNTSGTSNYKDLALTHIIPSGWEIYNERITNTIPNGEKKAKKPAFTYRDIRDDRVLTYFDLAKGQKVTFELRLMANYLGDFILPAIQCEAMYDPKVRARTKAGRVKVTP